MYINVYYTHILLECEVMNFNGQYQQGFLSQGVFT
jgi:hypothetical protein